MEREGIAHSSYTYDGTRYWAASTEGATPTKQAWSHIAACCRHARAFVVSKLGDLIDIRLTKDQQMSSAAELSPREVRNFTVLRRSVPGIAVAAGFDTGQLVAQATDLSSNALLASAVLAAPCRRKR